MTSSGSFPISSLNKADREAGADLADKLAAELMENHLTSDPHFALVFSAAFFQGLIEEGWVLRKK